MKVRFSILTIALATYVTGAIARNGHSPTSQKGAPYVSNIALKSDYKSAIDSTLKTYHTSETGHTSNINKDANTNTKVKAKAEVGMKIEMGSTTEIEPKTKVNIKAESETDIETEATTGIEPKTKVNIKAESETDIETEATTEIEAKAKVNVEADNTSPHTLQKKPIVEQPLQYKAENTRFAHGIGNEARFTRPFWSDMHSTITRGEVAMALNTREYDWSMTNKPYRPYVFANLGIDAPLWSGNFKNGKYGITVTVPFMIDVWLDMFERITAPVINTSYRFGLPEVGIIRRMTNPSKRGLNNWSLKISPLKHECAHIGDELTLYRQESGFPLVRINVSYNYSEFAFTLNDPDGSLNHRSSYRIGVMVLHDWAKGWYDISDKEGDVTKVVPSKLPMELYVQYQYQTNTSKRTHLQGVFSIELRNRVKYNYPFYLFDKIEDGIKEYSIPEYRAWCINTFVGVRYNNPKAMKYHTIGLGIRAYMGINPYGQFRSVPFYNQLGMSLLFE